MVFPLFEVFEVSRRTTWSNSRHCTDFRNGCGACLTKFRGTPEQPTYWLNQTTAGLLKTSPRHLPTNFPTSNELSLWTTAREAAAPSRVAHQIDQPRRCLHDNQSSSTKPKGLKDHHLPPLTHFIGTQPLPTSIPNSSQKKNDNIRLKNLRPSRTN